MLSTNAASRRSALEAAIAADPNFGKPYTELVRLYLMAGDKASAEGVLKRADERISQFTDMERAQLEYVEGAVRNRPEQQREALMALSRLVSTDIQTLHTLAEMEVNQRRFASAADLFKSALALDPDNAGLLNELGYSESYKGNLDGARSALERYRAVMPHDPNSMDSLGEVHFFAGRFVEAERYFLEAQKLSPGFRGGVELLKAAQARFLGGNLNGADELYSQYDQLRRKAGDPLVDTRKAQWLYITGRQKQAMAAAEAAANGRNAEVNAYALCHLSLWAIDAGDKAKAADLAGRALQARSPLVQRLAALCRAIASPGETPAGLDPVLREVARGYAALLNQDPNQAASVFGTLYRQTQPPVDGDVRTLYAWALAESGKRDEARQLLQRYYLPMGSSDEAMLPTFTFPRFLALRSALLDSPGTVARKPS